MKQIRLPATEPEIGINIDLAGVYNYEKDDAGADLLCGHCDAVIFAAHPLYTGGNSVHIEGFKCSSCGWHNTLSTSTLK